MPSDAEVARRILSAQDPAGDSAVAQQILGGQPSSAAPAEEAAPSSSMTPGSLYTDYIGGPAHDYLSRIMKEAGVPGALGDLVVGTVAPETLSQAGMAVGTMLAPEAKIGQFVGTEARTAARFVPMLKRLLGPMAGGAIGGYLDQFSPVDATTGAAQGLFAGATGETISAGSRWLAKSRLARYFADNDPKVLGTAIQNVAKDFPTMQTPEQFGSAVWGRVAQNKISDMYSTEIGQINDGLAKALVGAPTRIPASRALQPQIALFDPRGNLRSPVINDLQKQGVIGSVTTFDELSQAVRDLRLKGRTASGDPKLDLNGRQARDYAEQLSQEVSDGLATVSSGLAKRYREMDQRYGQGAEMLRFLKQPGLVDEDGKLNMKVLQEAFKEERRSGIERRFTPAQVKELSDAIFRGAPATATDVMKRASYSGGVGESAQIGKYRIFGNLMDKLGGGNPYAGKYDLPAPYVTPKTAGLAAQRVGGGIGYALDRPISLTAPDEETP